MAIIYTYPVKTNPVGDDLILISDSADSNNTKQVKVSTLPGGSGSGVSSVTAVSPLRSTGGSTPAISLAGLTSFGTTGQVIKVNSNADGLEWGAAGGGTPAGLNTQIQYNNNGSFGGSPDFNYTDSTKTLSIGNQDRDGGIVDIAGGQIGGAGQLRFGDDGTSGGYITLKGAADVGNSYNIVLPGSAPGGANKILESDASGNLSWITTPTGTTYSAMTDVALGLGKLRYATGATPSAVAQTTTANRTYGVTENSSNQLIVNVPWTDNNTTYTGSSGITLTGTNFTNGDRGSSQFIFKNIAVSGQNTVAADSNNDTLTLAAGNNITLTTDNTTDTVTIASSGGSGGSSGHCSVDWADGSSSQQMGTPIRFYRFTNTSNFTASRGWIFVTDNAEAGGESPLLFRLGIYSGSNMGIPGGLRLLGSGVSSASPSIGLLKIDLTAEPDRSLALSSGTSYYFALLAQNGLSATAVAGKTASPFQTVALSTAGTLPAATSLPTSAPGEGESFSANNVIFACTLV
ncbi:hypothetical protein N9K77_00010 [bacterium]|nr:hypothetical protein [bacterium]